MLLAGGPGRPEGLDTGFYIRPTLFEVDPAMRVNQEEIFGPVLCIMPFDTEEQAIALANDSVYGLGAYVQTLDIEKAQRVARQLRAGNVSINGAAYDYDVPFGGTKQSGNGRENGVYGLHDFLDIKAIADVAHSVGVPLIVDNTVATPYLIKPIDFGADVVVHSATKFLSGHGNAVVGAIIDAGKFDYAQHQDRFPGFNKPDPSYHGLVFSQALGVGSAFGANLSYIFKIRLQLLRDIGAAVSPFNAWLLAQGLETLSLRMDRHIENAKAVATWLEAHPDVEKVSYAALKSSPWNALATKYAPKGPGAVLSFELKGGVEAGKKFVESLKLFSHVANIGDVRSLVIHPATTTHSQLSPAEQLEAGVTPGLVRLSLGLENIQDIKADLEAGFAATKG